MKPFLVLILVLAGLAALFFSIQALSSHEGPTTVANSQTDKKPETTKEKPTPVVPTNEAAGRETAAPQGPKTPSNDATVEVGDRTNSLVGVVVNAEGKPVPGASVTLSRNAMMGEDLANEYFLGRDKPIGKPISTVADANGSYRFKNLEPSRDYYIFVTHKEYSPTQESHVAVAEEGESRAPEAVLRAGSTLTGFVYDENSNGIAGAQVALDSAYVMGSSDPKSPDRLTAVTDNTGYFELRNVAAGPRNITAYATGFGNETKTNLMFKGASEDRQQIEFKLKTGHPIAGRVVIQGTNQGIKGAQVVAMTYNNNSSSRGEAVANDDGSFQIDGLQQGAYMVQVEVDCYRQQRMNRIQVGDMNVLIEMIPRAKVSGRVVDGANNPVKAYKATVMRTSAGNGQPGQGQPIYENSDIGADVDSADGSFSICNFDPGTYVIQVDAPGYATAMSDKFTIAENQPATSVTVKLSAGGGIRGRVVDPSGNPIKGAVISSGDPGDDDPIFGSLLGSAATQRKVRSDRDGNFEIKMLAAADYKLTVTHPSYTRTTLPGLRVVEGQVTDSGPVTLKPGGALSGRVLDQAGKPVARGYVHLVSIDNPELAFDGRTDSDGHFSVTHLPAGNYQASAMRSPPGAGGDPFQNIAEQQASQVQVNVLEGQESTHDLNIGGN